MGYEIPQQLQHKERILFGLTFGQLAWAILFLGILLVILKLPVSGTSKFMIAFFPAMLGILFVFFDIGKWVKNVGAYLSFRSANINSGRMKRLIEIKKVEKGIIHCGDEVAVLQVTPLNFSIRTKDEKDTIIYGFQKFLNGLDFSVQIVVTTNGLNMESYLSSLKTRVNNMSLFEDFAKFLRGIISKNEMRNRDFYLVIPKKSDLEIQCNVCKNRLEGLGLRVRRLENEEILKKLYSFFNDVQDKRELKEGFNSGLHYLIAPNFVKDNVDSIILNEKHCRVISAIGYPRIVESGFLDKIIGTNDDFDISIHIEPYPIGTMMVMLNKEIQKQRADLFTEKQKNSINPSLEIKYKDTLKVLEELQKGQQKLFNVSLYINCKGRNKEELNLLTKKVEAELNSLMIVPSIPYFQQIKGYKSLIPTAKDHLQTKRNITTGALSAFFPFTSPFLNIEESGIMLGLNKNKVPFIQDIFKLSNANGIVLATSGSGKSYFTKLLLSRQLLNNAQVLIIDPQSEYIGLVGHCKGELITISRNSKSIINPLDLMGHDYIEKRLALMDMFKIMFGDLTEIQKSILDKAINETYAKKGINADSYRNKKPPILGDLYKTLVAMDKKATQMEKITYRALINRLYMYTHGVFSFMNKETNLKFKNRMVCFNIGDMPKQVKPLVMFLILDYVYMRMKESKEKKLLVVDEAWSLLGKAEEASYIFEIVKTCRKYNMGLLLITQDVADLVNSKAGHAVLANSSYTLLLRQKPSVIDSIVKTFHLSEMEREYLLTATQGRGILIMDNEHQELEVVASPEEHKIITTNPNEVIIESKPEKDTRAEINISLDTNKGIYYGSKISIDEQNYLSNHGYKPGFFVPIGKVKQEECWVKENNVESLSHTFLVQNIKQLLEKYTKEIELYITERPDIIFKNKKGQSIALEVETGKGFDKHKKRLAKKFWDGKIEFGKNYYIVLTDTNMKRKYQAVAIDIPVIVRKDIPKLLQTQFKTKK